MFINIQFFMYFLKNYLSLRRRQSLSTSYPQVIHKLSTSYPQVINILTNFFCGNLAPMKSRV